MLRCLLRPVPTTRMMHPALPCGGPIALAVHAWGQRLVTAPRAPQPFHPIQPQHCLRTQRHRMCVSHGCPRAWLRRVHAARDPNSLTQAGVPRHLESRPHWT
eukprot:682203-Rhodomonas_salina.1